MPLLRPSLLVLLAACFTACEHGKSPNPGDSGASDSGTPDTDIVDTDVLDTSTTDTDTSETGVIDTGGTHCPDDYDCDGLTDAQEAEAGTYPDEDDSDGDTLSDWEELLTGTDPTEEDTDGDGLPDNIDPDPGRSGNDTDGDGLVDTAEAVLGTNSGAADTDGDTLDDLAELLGDSDPLLKDTDEDGLEDDEELAAGTDPESTDTDGDTLSDYDEVMIYRTTATLSDTDGDGYDDDVELLAGSDPLDLTDVPGSGAGDVVVCESAGLTEGPGAEFYNAALDAGLTAAEAQGLYPDWDRWLEQGTQCACDVVLTDPTEVTPIGVSVWIPSRAHDDTNWSNNPLPAAVMLEVPATWTNTERRFTNDAEANAILDDFDVETDHWFAFDDISTNRDEEWDLTESSAIDTSGVYTIWVSFANVDGDTMETCDVLADATTPENSLHFRVDLAAPPPSPAPPTPDGLACAPSSEAHTLFGLADLGEGTRPLPLAGSPFVGAGVKEISVTDWRGADRLEVHRGAGLAVVLTPEHPMVQLQQPIPLAEARWRSLRTGGGAWSDPVIDVRHACPTGAAPQIPSNLTSVSWSELDEALRTATGGIGLEVWHPEVVESEIPALRARIEVGGGGRPDHLVFEAAGGGRLDALVLAKQAEGSWTFHHRQKGLTFDGALVASGNDLLLSVSEGTLTLGQLPITLAPTSLLLLGGNPE